jgi:hypothetical protein
MLFICVLSVGKIGRNEKENLLTGGDMKKIKTCSFHHVEFIPCIVNVTGFMDSLNYPKTKSFPMSYHYNCPICEREHWKSVYAEWGTYFISD